MPAIGNRFEGRNIKHRRVSEFLRSQIRSGAVRAGDKMPSYDQLVAQFETSKIAINRALGELEAEGLIEIRPRSGVYVADTVTSGQTRGTVRIGVAADAVHSYWSLMLRGAHEALLDHDIEIVLINLQKDIDFKSFGGVIYGGFVPDFHPRDVPAIVVGTIDPEHASICVDDFGGCRAATEHLISLGHTRIAYLGHPGDPTVAKRVAGYRFAMESAGLPCYGTWQRSIVYHGKPHPQFGAHAYHEMKEWLESGEWRESGCTALLAQNDIHAASIYRALAESGIRVPDDVSVVGFDDLPECQVMHPTLTTMRSPIGLMGRIAVESLVGQSLPSARVAPTATLLQAELVVRESTAPPRDAA